ncbi:putative H+-transporting two-sector ATPase chain b precursor, mitochondrial [Cantharellus anzutake]|uniref:putative H+-transporting two-sector ATPase chain b precursor, mitochondrial n=1 Tax=Cantharellus anzutake TaxID=1750568 RepID=UPI001902D6F3|nr:putative H+-transporting two-sector ATPase chain b precursor, mitochondrial [Cantharellus anzutake]KAF8328389.1 putative H+-transporting two-sector ATPase chain b precursor, mitochondrial [Cantharellus anzutake]
MRIAAQNLKAAGHLVRPRLAATVPRLVAVQSSRGLADSRPPPTEKANAILDSIPGNSLVSKTGTVILGTGAVATAISQELYVATDETVLLIGTLAVFTFIVRAMREPYKEWAEANINRIKDILESTRAEHTRAVTERIDSVKQMKDVVDVTKALFAVSKETAKLESEAFVLKQQVALAAELKAILDSWARYEQQIKESEQAELTKTVIDKVLKALQDEKAQKDILLGAVAEIEQLVKNKKI